MTVEVCRDVAAEIGYMEMSVDIAHRLGKYQSEKTHPIIVLFSFHTVSDAVWFKSEDSPMLKEKRLKFTEDLTQLDKAARNKLWPLIEKARKEGRKESRL